MGYYFSPYQIAELAVEVEEAGAKFYKYLADQHKDGKTKKVFLFLFEQELIHRNTFREIADGIKQYDSEQEYSINIAELLKKSIERLKVSAFNTGSLEANSMDIKKGLDIAIYTEEEAVRIYKEIYHSFIEKFHKVILEIIHEEEKHLRTLLNVKNKLQR